MRILFRLLALGVLCVVMGAQAEVVRLKDLGRIAAMRENGLVGYGLVSGLAGTGDSARNKATRQSLANMLARFDLAISSDDVLSHNVAAVMVTASLPSYARAGDTLDVTVTSIGDARSLAGGNLLLAPLKGPDGKVYALAQGALTVGGYRYDANENRAQENHPTVGLISGGATVEVGLADTEAASADKLTFVLQDADYTTASRVADAVNAAFGTGSAQARDAEGIDVRVPAAYRQQIPAFVRMLEMLNVEPDRRARVIVNERTGTVVAGGDVQISKVTVSQGDLKVTVASETEVSQPLLVRQVGSGIHTQVITNSQLTVEDKGGAKFVPPGGTTVADLVQALVRMKASTRDVIAVLQAVKAAGALHAELVVQ
jgi:flagellar P-ring protein precursor FlgI